MQEGAKGGGKRRVVITSATTLCLIAAPYVAISERFAFLIPGVAELAAYVVLIFWVEHKERSASKKAEVVRTELRSSIEEAIAKLADERQRATPAIRKVLDKQLMELYKERDQEFAEHRNKLREDFHKLCEDQKASRVESETLKSQAVQKVGGELEKMNGEKS